MNSQKKIAIDAHESEVSNLCHGVMGINTIERILHPGKS